MSQRAADACDELASICSAGGDCTPQQALCGSNGTLFNPLFVAETTCKQGCDGETSCLRSCKSVRVTAITTYLRTADLNGDGEIGDGMAACSSLSSTCAESGQGCLAGEFFCIAAAPAPSSCTTELDACKASCAPHDRACLRSCRQAYRQCTNGTTSPDAGVPDAPTTTTYDLTYGTTAGSTGTGSVTVNPAGTSCGTNCASYAAGTTVTLTATPSTGSSFTKWVGCTSTTTTCTVTMTAAMSVTATFTQTTTTTNYNLTYGTTAGSTGTGTISRNPAGTSCGTNCATYAAGTTVTLTATPSTGSSFTKWVGCASTTTTCTVTMTAAMTVTATFTKNATAYTYTLDIAPKMTGLCNGCHSGASAPGNYFTDTYTGLFGNGSDGTPNIIAGNGSSLFVTKIAGNHKNVLGQYPGFDKVVYDWVVSNAAAK